jgi:hypothetical protein
VMWSGLRTLQSQSVALLLFESHGRTCIIFLPSHFVFWRLLFLLTRQYRFQQERRSCRASCMSCSVAVHSRFLAWFHEPMAPVVWRTNGTCGLEWLWKWT